MSIIDEIIEIEWPMFNSTQNIGGQASCQENRRMFEIMRGSQFSTWPKEILESYLQDVKKADEKGINLITVKYGYMMESTSPEEYAAIADRLPEVSDDKKALVEAMVQMTVTWAEEFAAKYPHVSGNGRPIHTCQDTMFATSIETYSRGELSTYSENTLNLLNSFYTEMKEKGINLSMKTVEAEMHMYGLPSLEEAERVISKQ